MRKPALTLSARALSHLEMIGTGVLAPLRGFLGSEDYRSVLATRRLASGEPWTIPIMLGVTRAEAAGLPLDAVVELRRADGALAGTLALEEKFETDRRADARVLYGTESEAHPGVALFLRDGETFLAGRVSLLLDRPSYGPLDPYWAPPAETRRVFKEKGWKTVAGFQTRNAPHRGHEFLMKTALSRTDGLFLHPTAGETKGDDLPAAQRFPCYRALADRYLPAGRVVLALNPSPMHYAGPREAVHHAIMRRNYGCTHFVVGRDHAGVIGQYRPYEAQESFSMFEPGELGIEPIFCEKVLFCRECGDATLESACGHAEGGRLEISGTRLRAAVEKGEARPEHIVRPEVWSALLAAREAVA